MKITGWLPRLDAGHTACLMRRFVTASRRVLECVYNSTFAGIQHDADMCNLLTLCTANKEPLPEEVVNSVLIQLVYHCLGQEVGIINLRHFHRTAMPVQQILNILLQDADNTRNPLAINCARVMFADQKMPEFVMTFEHGLISTQGCVDRMLSEGGLRSKGCLYRSGA